MKCRLCGFELDNDRSYCPMCGTKVEEAPKASTTANTDIAWNTKDFPKPKKLEDINMSWGGGYDSFMANDASEGFVSVEPKEEAAEKPSVDPFELPPQMKVEASSMENPFESKKEEAPSNFDSWKMPEQKEEPKMPLWYTQNFTATGVMKTGPAYPINDAINVPAPMAAPMPTPSAKEAAAALSASMPDATIQFVRVDEPKPVYSADYDAYKPNYESVSPKRERAPERFNTFVAKNAEFQALLDKEYDRIHAARKEEASVPAFNTANKIARADKVKAQNITDFEKTIYGEGTKPVNDFSFEALEPVPAFVEQKKTVEQIKPVETKPERAFVFDDIAPAETPAPAVTPVSVKPEKAYDVKPEKAYDVKPEEPKVFSYDSDTSELKLEDLISDPLDPRFNIDTIELTIKQLELEEKKEELERQNRQSRLEAMKAAREAYFKFLDNSDADSTVINPVVEEEPAALELEVAEEEEEFVETPSIDERYTANTIELDEMESEIFEREVEDATRLPAELIDLYSEDEDEEEKPKKSHGILRFFLVLVIIVALAEGVIFGLQRFLPDAKITAQAVEMQEAVVDAFSSLFNKGTVE